MSIGIETGPLIGMQKVMCFSVDLHENLVQMPLPIGVRSHPLDTLPPDLGSKHRAKSVPPETDRFMAYIDPSLVQRVLDISKR